MLNESDYLVNHRSQVICHLNLLVKQKCLLSLNFNEGKTFITTLLAVEPQNDLVLFDGGHTDSLNHQLLAAAGVEFNTSVSGIKVRFRGEDIKKIDHGGETVFSMPIPKSILWMQRRQFYRVKLPLFKSNFLKLIVDDKFIANLALYDISISGFAVVNECDGLFDLFERHRIVKGCRLILENFLDAEIEFEIITVLPLNPNISGSAQKIGCKFIALKPAIESAIQRYMQRQERKEIAK